MRSAHALNRRSSRYGKTSLALCGRDTRGCIATRSWTRRVFCRGNWSASPIGEGGGSPSATSIPRAPSRCASSTLRRSHDSRALVRKRLREALALRRARLDLAKTNAFRWVHGEADRLPGIHVDVYADVAAVRFDGEGSRAFYGDLPGLLASAAGEVLRLRKVIDREARGEQAGGGRGARERRALPGRRGPRPEGGLVPRPARQPASRRAARPRQVAAQPLRLHRRILRARRPRAALRTDTVDIARPRHRDRPPQFRAQRSRPRPGGLSSPRTPSPSSKRPAPAARPGTSWSRDPPSFAPSKSSLAAARRSYLRLHRLAAQVVRAPGGLSPPPRAPATSAPADFLALVETRGRPAGRRFVLESYTGAGPDHPTLPVFPEGDYLKFALGRVE